MSLLDTHVDGEEHVTEFESLGLGESFAVARSVLAEIEEHLGIALRRRLMTNEDRQKVVRQLDGLQQTIGTLQEGMSKQVRACA